MSNRLREKGLSKCRTGTHQGALIYENPELKSLWVQSTIWNSQKPGSSTSYLTL